LRQVGFPVHIRKIDLTHVCVHVAIVIRSTLHVQLQVVVVAKALEYSLQLRRNWNVERLDVATICRQSAINGLATCRESRRAVSCCRPSRTSTSVGPARDLARAVACDLDLVMTGGSSATRRFREIIVDWLRPPTWRSHWRSLLQAAYEYQIFHIRFFSPSCLSHAHTRPLGHVSLDYSLREQDLVIIFCNKKELMFTCT